MKKRILLVAAIAALAIPATASATFWSWGYNYLGPSTNNGLCPPTVPSGRVCSGSAFWFENYMDKRNGGAVCLGFATNTTSSCVVWTGVVVITDKPGYENVGPGPWHSQLNYEYGDRSYLYNSATT